MSIYSFPALAACILNIFILLLVVVNNRKKGIVFPYILYNLSVSLWNFGLYLVLSANDMQTALKYNYILIMGLFFLFPTVFHFTRNFTNNKQKITTLLAYLAYILSFCLLFIYVVYGHGYSIEKFFFGYYPVIGKGVKAIPDIIYAVCLIFYMSYTEIMLYRIIKISSGQKRNQYQYIFWGTIIGASGGVSNIITLITKIELYPFANLTSMAYSITVAYALTTVKMIDLGYLARKIITVSGACCACIILNYFIVKKIIFAVLPEGHYRALASVIVVSAVTLIIYNLYKDRFSGLTAAVGHYTEKLQDNLLRIRNSLEMKQLFKNIFNIIPKIFSVEKVIIKIRGDKNYFIGNYRGGSGETKIEQKGEEKTRDMFLEYSGSAGKNNVIIRDEIEKKIEIGKKVYDPDIQILDKMSAGGFAVLVVLGDESGNNGYILLGNKLSGNMFSVKEINYLKLLKQAVEISIRNIKNVALLREQQQAIEREVQKASRLESLGFLAAGIAHDFSNILTSVMGNITLLRINLKPQGEIAELLTDSERAIRKSKDLTGQLATFAKGTMPLKHITYIPDLVEESVKFALGGTGIKYRFFIPDDLWLAEVDASQFSQVIDNIVINAVQAMPDGGKIEVYAENTAVGGDDSAMKAGNYVNITIRDSGEGIAAEDIDKIYELYFTTKKKGGGLGLAIVYSIVQKHNGYINVESKKGAGTAFYIYLPATVSAKKPKARKAHEIIEGTGRILLVDDDRAILKAAGKMLKDIGYDCEVAQSGSEAVSLYKKAQETHAPFDGVILDFIMPGDLAGDIILERLIEADPAVKGIISSGYSDKPVMSDPEKYGFKDALPKPYTLQELSKVLSDVLRK